MKQAIDLKQEHDLTGQRFGRLVARTVHYIRDKSDVQRKWWLCDCDCGKQHMVRAYFLRNGSTQSCGCSRYEGRTIRSENAALALEAAWSNK